MEHLLRLSTIELLHNQPQPSSGSVKYTKSTSYNPGIRQCESFYAFCVLLSWLACPRLSSQTMNGPTRSTTDSPTCSSSILCCHNGHCLSLSSTITLYLKTRRTSGKEKILEVDQVVGARSLLRWSDENELEMDKTPMFMLFAWKRTRNGRCPCSNVVCIILSTASDSNEWKRTSIFLTFLRSRERTC